MCVSVCRHSTNVYEIKKKKIKTKKKKKRNVEGVKREPRPRRDLALSTVKLFEMIPMCVCINIVCLFVWL